ncbi:unnamed protein product [Candida verbasci]|uniref:Transcription factor tau 91 kDa subunit n=1 Tax=Candida verbasci TaxID=1227364 RepID=A0A9W4XC97_9ASCO|nr:unnamed protein product [Candida verbasci]
MFKPSKEGSFKSRIVNYYGQNIQLFEKLKLYKEKLGDLLFYPSESIIKQHFIEDTKQLNTIPNNQLNIKNLLLKPVDLDYVNFRFNSNKEINLKLNKETIDNIKLEHDHPANLKSQLKRNAHILSTGGTITSQQWLPRPINSNSNISYLAVSIFNNPNGIEDMFNPELRVFKKIKSDFKINSAVQIWEYNLETNTISLKNVLITTHYGSPIEIKWVPIYTEDNVLGVLSGVFTGGDVHFFKIDDNLPKYSVVENSSFTYSSNNEIDEEISNICCFDFMGDSKMLIGLDDGYIAEYQLPFNNSESESELNIPNFKYYLSDGNVSSILSCETKTGEYLNVINTHGLRSYEYSSINPIQDVFTPLVFKTVVKPSFNYFLQSYIASNTFDTNNLVQLKMPMDTQASYIRGDFYLSCSELSNIISHPFCLIGGSDGGISILNVFRRLSGQKASHKFTIPLKLWKFAINEEEKLSLEAAFESFPVENPKGPSLERPEVIVSSLSWNCNVTGSSVYSAGTASGILVIERLDPEYN